MVDLARERGDVRGMIAALREIGLVCGYYDLPHRQCADVDNLTKRMTNQLESLSDEELMGVVNAP